MLSKQFINVGDIRTLLKLLFLDLISILIFFSKRNILTSEESSFENSVSFFVLQKPELLKFLKHSLP